MLREERLTQELGVLSRHIRKRPVVLFLGRPNLAPGDVAATSEPVFSDNTKYLFLEALSAPRDFEVRWGTLDARLHQQLLAAGLPSVLLRGESRPIVDLLLQTAVVVYSVSPWEALAGQRVLLSCLEGACQIQLWHGVSVKRLMLQLTSVNDLLAAKPRPFWATTARADWFLSTAPCFDGFWREASGCRNLVRAGLPRNEVLFRPPTPRDLIGATLPEKLERALSSGKPVVLLAPTWHRGVLNPIANPTFLESALKAARRLGVTLALKSHPFLQVNRTSDHRPDDDVHTIEPGVDIYPHLRRFRALVTDYSSIMFDFLLTGRPLLTLASTAASTVEFEPDYSLVPPGDFRMEFTAETFGDVLASALSDASAASRQMAYAKSIFPTDPRRASSRLLGLIADEVATRTGPDFKVRDRND